MRAGRLLSDVTSTCHVYLIIHTPPWYLDLTCHMTRDLSTASYIRSSSYTRQLHTAVTHGPSLPLHVNTCNLCVDKNEEDLF